MHDDNRTTQTWAAVDAVRDWLSAAGLPVHEHPTLDVAPNAREMACALIEEEVAEFRAAVEASDLVEIADAVADLIWVVVEAGVTFGIPIEEIFAEVRRSNLTKIESGEPVVNTVGKIVAGPGFSAPDLLPILAAHARSSEDVAEWLRQRRPE
jgi:predicted HAD superfamily Cof-like phosphohydrolase